MRLKDIAELANTSVSTVSRSLNDSDLIAEETKQRIKAIAEAEGFEFNAMARGLATKSVGTIGIILPENYDRFDVLLYHAALHNDFRRSLERADIDIIVAFKENRFSGRDNIRKLISRKKVDGLILVQANLDPETCRYLNSRKIPFVLAHYPPAESSPAYDVIYSDNWMGGKFVAEHFINRGYRKIICITGGNEQQSIQRLEGFRAALTAQGIEFEDRFILEGNYQSARAVELVRKNKSLFEEADALFAFNDFMAFGALQVLHSLGMQVPGDLAIAGYDDTPLAAETIPGLTSIHQAHEEIALLSIEYLLDVIEHKNENPQFEWNPRTIAIQPRLVVRDSTGNSHN